MPRPTQTHGTGKKNKGTTSNTFIYIRQTEKVPVPGVNVSVKLIGTAMGPETRQLHT